MQCSLRALLLRGKGALFLMVVASAHFSCRPSTRAEEHAGTAQMLLQVTTACLVANFWDVIDVTTLAAFACCLPTQHEPVGSSL